MSFDMIKQSLNELNKSIIDQCLDEEGFYVFGHDQTINK